MDIELSLTLETVAQAGPATPACVAPELSLGEALRLLRSESAGAALVCRHGQLCGIFTERDALRAIARSTPLATPLGELMTANPVTIDVDASIADAIRSMVAGGYRRLPVVDREKRPTGVVGVSGIIHFLVEHFPRTIYNLNPAPHASTRDREGS